MQADVFGAADLALLVAAGTQNPELGAADLWSPAAILRSRRVAAGSQTAATAEACRKRHGSSAAVRRLTVFVFSVMVSRIRNALRRSFRLQD
jgi:hypothetical protein